MFSTEGASISASTAPHCRVNIRGAYHKKRDRFVGRTETAGGGDGVGGGEMGGGWVPSESYPQHIARTS